MAQAPIHHQLPQYPRRTTMGNPPHNRPPPNQARPHSRHLRQIRRRNGIHGSNRRD
ncbi:hypothetical protein BDV12DRAFT_161408 [Aspergillus spectabilis]